MSSYRLFAFDVRFQGRRIRIRPIETKCRKLGSRSPEKKGERSKRERKRKRERKSRSSRYSRATSARLSQVRPRRSTRQQSPVP